VSIKYIAERCRSFKLILPQGYARQLRMIWWHLKQPRPSA